MAQLILLHSSSSSFHHSIRTRSLFPLSVRVGKFFLLFSMTFMIGLLSLFYLVKFTEIHTKGYELRKLEIERDRLKAIRENKNMEIAQLKSLQIIRTSGLVENMLPVKDIFFIKQDGTIAHVPAAINKP